MDKQAIRTMCSVAVGDQVDRSATDPSAGAHTVTAVDPKGFAIARHGSGKALRCTWAMVGKTVARLLAGERLMVQASPANGGISFTCATTRMVEYALRGIATREGSPPRIVLASGGRKRISEAS